MYWILGILAFSGFFLGGVISQWKENRGLAYVLAGVSAALLVFGIYQWVAS